MWWWPTATIAATGRWLKRSEEHTSELQSRRDLVCRLLLEKKKKRPRRRRGEKFTQLPISIKLVETMLYRIVNLRLLDFFFFNDTATTEIYTLSLHDALPISGAGLGPVDTVSVRQITEPTERFPCASRSEEHTSELQSRRDLVCRLLLEK